VTPKALARPYAAALIEVVGSGDAGTQAESALRALAEAIRGHDELRRVLDSPAVPAAKKRAIVDGLLQTIAGVPVEVRRLVSHLVDEDRIGAVNEIAEMFSARLRRARNIVEAEVVTSQPLGDDGRAALSQALSRVAGGSVQLTERTDPSIIGGVVARVGSTVYDSSVTRQLARMRQRLLGQV
jgi:F-type H+-transporting ATPase subunit delta